MNDLSPEIFDVMSRTKRTEACRRVMKMKIQRQSDPLRVIIPHPAQAKFFDATERFRLFGGGNGAGKTFVLIAETASVALGFRPWEINSSEHTLDIRYDDLPREKKMINGKGRPIQVPNRTLIMAKGMDAGISKVVIPKLREMCLPYIKKFTRGSGGTVSGVEWKNGSSTDFGSYDQDATTFAGREYTAIGSDEPMPREVWMELRQRLRDSFGRAWWTLTPLAEPWMYDELYSRGISSHEDDVDYFAVTCSKYENPWLEEDQDEERSLTEEEIEARVYGRWMHLSGRVFKTFDESVHVIDQFDVPADWTRYHICDPHDRRPFAMIWCAIDPRDEIYVYHEWPEDLFHKMKTGGMDPEAYSNLIKSVEGDLPSRFRLMDPRFGVASKATSGRTLADTFVDYGLFFDTRFERPTQSQGEISSGHMKIREYLAYDKTKPIDDLNRPHIWIMRNCRNVIWSFLHYVYSESRRTDKVRETPRESGKDFIDAVRWLCGTSPRYLQPGGGMKSRYEHIGSYGER